MLRRRLTLKNFLWSPVLALFLVSLTSETQGATNCEQEFTLLGIVQDRQDTITIWLAEHVYGECIWTRIIKLELSVYSVRDSVEFIGYKDWKAISKRLENKMLSGQREFIKTDSLWRWNNRYYNIRIPVVDSAYFQKYKGSILDPDIWNETNGAEAVVLPEIGTTTV